MLTKIQISKSGLTKFQIKVLQKLQAVPKGKITTYQILAKAVGRPAAARAVANALHGNPWLVVVPCHRVVRSSGELGGYTRGVKNKISILSQEGIKVKKGKIVDFKKKIYYFD